ncbi:condensin complex subunit 2-like isoform X2 [Aristolochia californica]|uniref:condensin complex subunit 2-like isoform X2 n=1 Tax=Aristolochia californica TaxID=171875 RepID=UPI0035D7BE47
MGECVTPNLNNPGKQKTPMASRLQSPTGPFFLGSNDDQLERAQARDARAAATRRKLVARPPPLDQSDILGRDQVMELFQNCIKLASENKINQKNTWELSLLDHLIEIIKVEEDDDAETNFQKASCTLEAGVKIYSMRVDSVHSEAYKVLGGINRAGREDDKEVDFEGDQTNDVQEDSYSKKKTEKKVCPLSTLESSFEALNVKKFDVAFAVDPLYHQMSAQFDEGGARGLLLNNLGVYGGCRILFDSLEMPGKSMPCATDSEKPDVIDISFARECVEQMMNCIPESSDISPTLRDIISQFDEDNRRPSVMLSVGQQSLGLDDAADATQPELECNGFDNCGPCSHDHEAHTGIFNDSSTFTDQNFPSSPEDKENYIVHEPDVDGRCENIADFLYLGLGFTSKKNAWAGPDHWKYRRVKGLEQDPSPDSGSKASSERPGNKRQQALDIDFVLSLEKEMPDIFCLPKHVKSLKLPSIRGPYNTLLPEDCHYQPEDLVKLFILSDVTCLAKSGKESSYESGYQSDSYDPIPQWDHEDDSNQFGEGDVLSDTEDSSTLVSIPRQVNKMEVQYDKSSKHVDVHALKDTLWNCMQEFNQKHETGGEQEISFCNLLREFPVSCTAAAPGDISVHLCFICLLHLANEHSLSIRDSTTLDELLIFFPQHS